jgi:hypothetical protein
MTARTPGSSERSDASRWLARLVAVPAFGVLVHGAVVRRLVLNLPGDGDRAARGAWLAVLRVLGVLVRTCHGTLQLF